VKQLRSYQREAVAAVTKAWESSRSTLLVLPTGCGKTLTAAEILRLRAPLGRTLWLAHREELITQAADAITSHAGLRCGIEMGQQRTGLTDFMGRIDVVVASVQTMHAKRRQRFIPGLFPTVVVDEGHHGTARSYRDILAHFGESKVLGLTATPDRGDKTGLYNVFETCAFQYEIRTAIQEGYLCALVQKRIECADLDISDVKTVAGDLNQGELERALSIDAVLHQIAGPLAREAEGRQTIVFTAGVAQAHALADVLAGYVGARKVTVIDGETPREVRAERIAAFREGRVQFILNCAVLTEGFDAPETACIAIARPTKSRALYTQMIGRGTRLAPGKADCLILDFAGNAGKHSLVSPLDVLAGGELKADVRAIAEKLASEGMPSEEALAKAEQQAAERARLEDEKRLRAAKIKAEAAYRAELVDPFHMFDVEADSRGPRATDAQLEVLRSKGITTKAPSRAEASALIAKLQDRSRKGLCTFKQARLLIKNGLPGDSMTFTDASAALDAIAKNDWRCPDWLRQKYATEAAE
jgi:superfamily II DNA or RNA helicase